MMILAFASLLSVAQADVPKVFVTTADGREVTSRVDDAAATLRIDPNGGDPAWALTAPVTIRGRGNSTWDMPKKPYRLRFTTPRAVLGLPADRAWSLLANYADKTLLRNILAFHIGRRLGLDFTPHDRAVRLIINGREHGVYELTEDIRVAPHRLDLTATDVTGGYLLELDRWMSRTSFVTPRGVPYEIASPFVPNAAQAAYARGYVGAAERALHGTEFTDPARGYAAYLHLPSFVDWYLVNEIMKNSDAANFSSIYLHKSSGARLRMGPLWDFDLAAGNTDYTAGEHAEGWWIRTESPWFTRLFEDPAFRTRVRARWDQLAGLGLDARGLHDFIDRTAGELDEAQRANFTIWPILDGYVWPNAVVAGSYRGEVDYLKNWLARRMRWLGEAFAKD